MKLYHDPQSRSVRPLILLEELGVVYDVELVSLRRGEHKSEAHRRRHPLAQLPVLVDGGTTIFESVAICLYIADRHPDGCMSPAVDSPERGPYYQWCTFVVGSLEHAMSRAYIEGLGCAPVPGLPGLDDVLGVLAAALERRDHLLESGYSTADVLTGSTLALLPSLGVELPAALQAYVERLRARPAFRKGLRP